MNVTGEPAMVKMGRLIKEERGIPHFGCTDHRIEKTAQRFYTHAGVEGSLTRAKAVVTFIHKSSQVPVALFVWYIHVRVYLVLFPLYTIY